MKVQVHVVLSQKFLNKDKTPLKIRHKPINEGFHSLTKHTYIAHRHMTSFLRLIFQSHASVAC